MDGIGRMNQMNPMSTQFKAKAIRTAQTQAATVKDKKDLSPKDGAKELDEDMVTLSKQGKKSIKDKMDSASQSGVMSDLMKKEKKGKLGEATMFGGKRERQAEKGATAEGKAAQGQKKAEEVDLGAKIEALTVMNRDPDEIRGDVPPQYFDASKKIVEGQIKKGEPAKSLTELKAVETAPLELKSENYVEIMPIHDTDNKPIPMDMGAGMKK
ncbi:MAG: hypothetical protein K8T10_00670 [Candidatus Eremiobacteraeota bacterium]|nr:hypothetical protein [Candidatus Eremiobacteraeota bacterium]